MILKNKTILITGSRGVIGKQLSLKLIKEGYRVLGTKRPSQNGSASLTELDIRPWVIPNIENFVIDIIIHLAASYETQLNIDKIQLISESNIGIATSVSELAAIHKIPVIAFGSFIEKYPGINGLSYYANSKKIAQGILHDYASKFQFALDYVYIYDSYSSDTSRGKFIDLLINQNLGDTPIFASGGYQLQDLVYIGDIIEAISELIERDNQDKINSWQIRTGNETTLRELSELLSEVKGFDLEVQWDHFPYGNRDVFKLWDCAENLLDFDKLSPIKKRLSEIINKKKFII